MYIQINDADCLRRKAKGVKFPLPQWRTIRSTSHLEAFHRTLQPHFHMRRMSADLFNDLWTNLVFNTNVRAGIRCRGDADWGTLGLEYLEHLHHTSIQHGWASAVPGWVPLPAGAQPLSAAGVNAVDLPGMAAACEAAKAAMQQEGQEVDAAWHGMEPAEPGSSLILWMLHAHGI